MKYLTRDDVLDLHTLALERYGGRLGIKSQDRLLSVVNAPQQIAFGEELYPDIASKAAVLGFQMLKNRPFIAANEPTALLAVLRFLELNEITLSDRLVDSIASELHAVLRSERSRDELTDRLRDRLGIGVEE